VAANVTPPVNYFYDEYSALPSGAPSWPGTPSKGRLIGVTYGPGSEGTYYKYDAAGRIVTNHQRMGTSNYATTYSYNRAGAVTREERGILARRRILMSYDAAGRIAAMDTGSYPFLAYVPLVRSINYTPFGGLQSETYGNGLIHSMAYNSRHQPAEIRLGRPDNLESVFRLGYIYGTASNVNGQDPEITLAHNNGNVARIKYLISGTVQYTQTFQYDSLNRLSYAVEHNNGSYNDGARAWYQTFDYDRYGNRGINVENTSDNVDAENRALQLADFSGANNRITHTDFFYDAAGNLIAEPGKNYTYDAENRIVTATVAGGAPSQYFYDGNGRRVKKVVGGVATRFEYGAGGELITERNDSDGNVIKDYFYKGGELLATSKIGNKGEYEYATTDHLGSPRAWTDQSGSLIAGGRHDYAPFGEELFAGVGTRTTEQWYASNTQQDGQRKQFGSKERDTETDLDFSQSRYYSNIQGRFTSVDPFNPIFEKQGENFFEWLSEPQRWNRYSYALNNPLRYVDEDGEDPLEAIKAGSRRIATLAAKIAQRSGGVVHHPLIMAAEVLETALEIAFPTIAVNTNGLNHPWEIQGARLAAAFEGKSFEGVNSQKTPGIDGVLHDGPIWLNRGIEPVQLQNNGPSNDVVGNIMKDADSHEGKVMNAGQQGVHLFVTVTDTKTTVSQVVDRIQADAKAGVGLVKMTSSKYIPKVTILTGNGAVRVQNGKIFSCDGAGKCTAN
jgi:RHS repeat-associated protein